MNSASLSLQVLGGYCLKIVAKEFGAISDDASSEERGRARANRLPLFPD